MSLETHPANLLPELCPTANQYSHRAIFHNAVVVALRVRPAVLSDPIPMFNPRSIALLGAPNFRDVGGLRTAEGRAILPNRVFRSERLSSLAPADVVMVRALGIHSVCDLRSEAESLRHPNRMPPNWAGDYLHLPIAADVRARKTVFEPLIAKPTAVGAREVMESIYRSFPQAFAPHFGYLIDCITRPALPLVIHCTAGKDRTGFAIAVLLSALDVPIETVFADYLLSSKLSYTQVTFDEVAALIASHIGATPTKEVVRTILGVDRTYLQAAFDLIDESYGSNAGYLKDACGVTQKQIVKLKAALLGDSPAAG